MLYRPKVLYATQRCAGDQKEWRAEKKWCGNASDETARSVCRPMNTIVKERLVRFDELS
jgi:hypothetical protein